MVLPMVPWAESGPLYGFVLPTLISVAVTPGWAKAALGTSVSDRSARPAMRRIGARIGGPPWPFAGRGRGGTVVGGLDIIGDGSTASTLSAAARIRRTPEQRPAPLRAERPRRERGSARAGAAPRCRRYPGAPRQPCGHPAPLRRIAPSRWGGRRDPSRRPTRADSAQPVLLDVVVPRTHGRATRG